jgi:16S rRNA (adenine1518-N6/adenine1519-N6)-dimethyltransferase
MVQADVADRLLASPGTRIYGSLTVAMAHDFAVEPVLRVPRQAFWPAPEVDSAVLRLTPHPEAERDLGDRPRLERVVRAGFAQRRKMLGRALAAGLAIDRSTVEERLRAIDLDPGQRAETLAPMDFVRVARALAPHLSSGSAEVNRA